VQAVHSLPFDVLGQNKGRTSAETLNQAEQHITKPFGLQILANPAIQAKYLLA
jgi:hypothetical protein